MLAALMVSFFCITGYLLYLDRRRKKARARAASAGMFTEAPTRRYISE